MDKQQQVIPVGTIHEGQRQAILNYVRKTYNLSLAEIEKTPVDLFMEISNQAKQALSK